MILEALTARNEGAARLRKTNPLVSFRAFSARCFAGYASWGAAPGYYISRLWRFQTNGVGVKTVTTHNFPR
jgi:hypothetical protein